ncbi:nitrilotriacetate monooxygenase component B [Hydrogenimonas sp.]|nr:nitrilotriacetate monooxygenase component B [Hydrogenimonas sp.]
MLFDYSTTGPALNYKLMSQTIIPRPIAWIVTEDEGVVNVAPFSYFTGLSSLPPTVIVSIGHKSDGMPKDTLANIRKNGKCTLCMVSEDSVEPMHFSSKEMPRFQSEAEEFGISLKPLVDGFPPIVESSPSAFFCELYKEIELPGSKTVPLILEIKRQFIDDGAVIDKDRLVIRFDPLARVGREYALLGENIAPPKIP